jgi:DeoR/GlpR family transcriptional regulator of sugar metabolism
MSLPFITNVDRQAQILRMLEERGRISLADLTATFQISEATARRDLDALAEQGKVQRVHGGAILLRQSAPEPPILRRQEEQAEEKERIGRAAAALVQDGETVFLGSGTTTLQVARALRSRQRLTVLTNSLPVINTLAGQANLTVVVLGGLLRDSELSFIGHITEKALAEVRADKVILGVRALSLEYGLTNDYLPEALTDRAILQCGRQVILVADHTKLNTVAAAFLAPLTAIHHLVTDSQAPADFLDSLRALGIQVTIA